jgi:hypothetical protein
VQLHALVKLAVTTNGDVTGVMSPSETTNEKMSAKKMSAKKMSESLMNATRPNES